MLGTNVIFTLDGVPLSIQCTENDVMKDICQKYVNKINRNINTLIFLYGGSELNFNLKYKDVITNKGSNEMKVLVYSNENDEFICPKCGEKIKFNKEKIDNIILSINNLKETIVSTKLMLENIIEKSSVNIVNIQLNGINIILNNLNEDINKIKEKVQNLLNENRNIEDNYIIAEINIKENDTNKKIRILNSYEECLKTDPDRVKKNENFKNEDEIKKCEIQINEELIPFNYFYKFKSKGKYIIKYSFKNKLRKTCFMFYECSFLTKINLSYFNTDNVNDTHCMFRGCLSLIDINFSNFNTNNITNMSGMFYKCSSLTNIDLSNFNTNNVTKMRGMFYKCSSLTNIDLSNFNTKNVNDIWGMFGGCKSLNKNNIVIKDRKILNDKNLFEE